ncbi:uncharacterized protein LOC108002331 [Apis cerana]|uniref:uncharacterized protein LOC108002331 n=1 Tax=Apis cerana TaxID=7461 RepID=UPI0007E2C84F|nr:uncharacterized protein LOC108002331 [Apis cerana]
MFKTEDKITEKSVIKKPRNKRKTYWCAPRKVKSTNILENIDNSLQDKKMKKRHHKKKRKSVRNMRRIDILAQPKSMKHELQHKRHLSNANCSVRKYNAVKKSISSNQKIITYPHKTLKTKKFKGAHQSGNSMMNITLKDSPIILPKKIGVRLFSLVKKRLKELTNSKKL